MANGASNTTANLTHNVVRYVQHVEQSQARVYDAIIARTTAATAVFALYSSDPTTGNPLTLLWSSAASTVTGVHTITFASGTWTAAGAAYKDGSNRLVTVYGTNIWKAVLHSASSVTFRALSVALCRNIGVSSDPANSGFTGFEEAATYPTLPATATPGAGIATPIPILALRPL